MSPTSNELYCSVPLPLGNSIIIRLLKISATLGDYGQWDDPIHCELHLASLTDPNIRYTALSYMWGTEAASKTITVNGTEVLVRSNLWEFLRQRRLDRLATHSDEPDLLWIDALSIDQANNLERNHQVAMMGKIYARACRVLIWLGAGQPDYDQGVRILAEYQCSQRSPDMSDESGDRWLQVWKVLNHKYWTRAWIVQECVLARQLDLQYGPASLRCLEESLITNFLAQNMELVPATGSIFKASLQRMSEDIDDTEPLPPANLVLRARRYRHEQRSSRRFFVPWTEFVYYRQCSDRRDKIYSQLTLLDQSIKIEPDYDKPVEQLFLDIVLQCQDQMELKDVDCLARILLHRQGDGVEDQSLSSAHDWHPIDRVELRRGEIALTAVVRRGLDHLSRVEHPHLHAESSC